MHGRRAGAQRIVEAIVDAFTNEAEREAVLRRVVGPYSRGKVETLVRQEVRRKYMEAMREGGAAYVPSMSQATLDETVQCVLDMFPHYAPAPLAPPSAPAPAPPSPPPSVPAPAPAPPSPPPAPMPPPAPPPPPSNEAEAAAGAGVDAPPPSVALLQQRATTLEARVRASERREACLRVQLGVMQRELEQLRRQRERRS